MSAAMRTCAIVPTHDHWRAIGTVIGALRAAALPVFVIDDGSVEPAATAIAALHCMDENVEVHRLAINQGKGAAVMHGMRLACKAGYTHAVQIDADGQHDMAALLTLLERSRQQPSALISAEPMFDASMPTGRRIGRRITHFWVWIEIMSLRVTDSMCGFRVYPLLAVQALLAEQSVGKRMEFDTEIMVRLFQRGTAVEMVPVRVSYPPGNTSNFRPLADNLRIGAMHARLLLSMLFRPTCARHLARHWAALSERGAWWGLRISAAACRLLGQRGCLLMLAPVVGYFAATAAAQRRASRDFLQRATGNPTTVWDVYRHFSSFAARLVESFRAWDGAIPAGAVVTDTSDALACLSADASGALLVVVAHLGNADLARALLDDASRSRLAILVHTHHAMNYNRLLRDFRPAAALSLIRSPRSVPQPLSTCSNASTAASGSSLPATVHQSPARIMLVSYRFCGARRPSRTVPGYWDRCCSARSICFSACGPATAGG